MLVSAPLSSASSRRLLQGTCDLNCSLLEACVTATCSPGSDAGSKIVTVDVSGCKNDYLSWVCCASASCTPRACNSSSITGGQFSGTTCNEVYTVSYVVPLSFVLMPLQLHDGRLVGNRACPNGTGGYGPGQCCGGSGGGCGATPNPSATVAQPAVAFSAPAAISASAAFPASLTRAALTFAAQPEPAGALNASTTPYTGTSVPGYVPGQSASSVSFSWQSITTVSGNEKWGGFFAVPSPPPPGAGAPPATYTTLVPIPASNAPLFICAGCADNDRSKGYYFAGAALSVTTYNSSYAVASCSVAINPPAGATYAANVLHLYASYQPLTTSAPGLWAPAPAISVVGGGGGGLPISGPASFTASLPVPGGTRPEVGATVYLACHIDAIRCV
ncbi:hypothetical protein GPECTOR_2g964 [Gonium pectorale]|uniref:Pherophorin domain-containing protein n=1 Tax=Gonium pectorale TaxID=33097 RepID=A0A150H293_GONPE|nr:hypothetical protein GPECTOR_2g964 [Gonium pectorale]|eukprot:KXZ56082.1 hypothetical protein GPECTOR_2g964 [Gonium pectorale]